MRWVVAVAAVVLVVLGWLGSREVFRARAGRASTAAPGGSETHAAPVEGALPETWKEEGRGEEEGGTLYRVKVVSRRDGSPIADAKVIDGLQRVRGVTGEDGTLEFRAESDWWYASAPGYFSVNGECDDEGNGWVALPPATIVKGRVFDAATGEGVANADIKLWAPDEGLGYESATSGEGGRFEVAGALWQGFSITVRAEGYAVTSYEGGDLTGPLDGVGIGLAGGATLEGHVFDADGAPFPRVTVGLQADGIWITELGARSDDHGTYRIPGVPLGVEIVPRTTYEHVAGDTVVFRDAGEVQQRDIRFPALAYLTVSARDAEGKEVEISRMELEHGGHSLSPGRNEAGWSFGVPGGRYVLDVLPYGWPEQAREVTLVAGRRQHEEFVLSGGLAIEGTLLGADGTPQPWTVAWSNGTLSGFTRSDADGRFRVQGLPAIPVRLDVDPWQQAVAAREGVIPGGAPIVIVLQPAARIIGRVVGVADPQALWTSIWCDSCSTNCDRMEEDGRFEFVVGYLGEPILLAFRRPGGPPAVFTVPPLASGDVHDLGEIRLDTGRHVRGRIVDAEGSPVIGALVEIAEPWASDVAPRPTRSDEAGRFSLFQVPEGSFRVRLDAKGYPPHFPMFGGGAAEIRLSVGGVAEGPGEGTFRLAEVSDWADNAYVHAEPAEEANTFRMRLQAGRYVGWVELPNGERFETLPLVVREGETTKVEIKPR